MEETEIEIKKALEILKGDLNSNVMEIDNILFEEKNGDRLKCFLKGGVLIVASLGKGNYIRIIPINESWDYDFVCGFIAERFHDCTVTVNIQKMNEGEKKKLREVFENRFKYDKSMVDYSLQAGLSSAERDIGIRELEKDDIEAFIGMENEPQKYRPPLNVLFYAFVMRKNGTIIAYFSEGKIVGYLSYNNVFDNIYDVDFIYVSPSHQGKGIAKKLALAYSLDVKSKKGVAYWSNARNIESEKTALSAGFTKAREALIFKCS